MKFKHNKKRNTALLYEYLVKELTRCVLKEDVVNKQKIVHILKEFFSKNSILARELEIYKSVVEPSELPIKMAEKILSESKKQFDKLNRDDIFKEQTKLLKEISSSVESDIFSNFVPQYKSLATIYQLFNLDASPKKKVLLEEKVLNIMTNNQEEKELELPVQNNLVFKKFIEGFNRQYEGLLLNEQKELLNKYIVSSFEENSLELKVYLNEELGRIKSILGSLSGDEKFKTKASKILMSVNQIKESKINSDSIKKILMLQKLAGEVQTNGN